MHRIAWTAILIALNACAKPEGNSIQLPRCRGAVPHVAEKAAEFTVDAEGRISHGGVVLNAEPDPRETMRAIVRVFIKFGHGIERGYPPPLPVLIRADRRVHWATVRTLLRHIHALADPLHPLNFAVEPANGPRGAHYLPFRTAGRRPYGLRSARLDFDGSMPCGEALQLIGLLVATGTEEVRLRGERFVLRL